MLVVDSCRLGCAGVRFPGSNAAGPLMLSPRPLIGTSEYYGADRVLEIRLPLRSRSGLIATESQGGRMFAHSATTINRRDVRSWPILLQKSFEFFDEQ